MIPFSIKRWPSVTILQMVALVSLLLVAFPARPQEVDLLTGRLRYSMPIGALQANDITIPISIYHHGASLKVAEGQGACGLGWGLSAGGSIHREVRGLPDELNLTSKKGWLYNNGANATAVQNFTVNANDELTDCTDEVSDYNNLQSLHSGYSLDTEPDLFTISAPGLSAQFVLNPSGTPKFLTSTDIVVEFYPNVLSMQQIVVKTNNGMVYTFGTGSFERDQTRRYGYVKSSIEMNTDANYFLTGPMYYGVDNSISFTTAWKLSTVASITSGTTATYKYEVDSTATADGASKRIYNLDSTNYILETFYSGDLLSIKLKSQKAVFKWTTAGMLEEILVQDTITQDQRSVRFDYMGAFVGQTAKSFLKKVSLNGSNCLPAEVHEFEYQDVTETSTVSATIPAYVKWKNNWGMDYFGYATNVSGKNKPTLYFAQGEEGGRRLRVSAISGVSTVTYAGDTRSPANTGMFGALKKIKLPTGGYAEIHYELNSYLDTSVSPAANTMGGGTRVSKIVLQGGEAAFGKTINDISAHRAITKEYLYTLSGSSNSSGLLLSPVKLGYVTKDSIERVATNLGEDPTVLYSRVVEKTTPSKGYTVYEFSIPGVFPESGNGVWKATKSKIARKPLESGCIGEGKLKNGYYLFPYAPSSNYDFRRGLPSRVATYSETGSLIREKTTTYTTRYNPSGNGVLKGLRFEKLGDIYYYGVYELLYGTADFVSQEVIKEASHEDPTKVAQTTVNYAYNADNLVSTITTSLPNSTTSVKSIKYARDFPFTSPPASDSAAVTIHALNTTNRGNAVVEEYTTLTVPGSSSTTTSANLTIYKDFGSSRVLPYYIKSLPPGSSFTPASMSGQSFNHDNTNYRLVRTLKEYDTEARLSTTWDDLKDTVSTHYLLSTSLPVATFRNARASQCLFEGFEGLTSFGLNKSGSGFIPAQGWTGEKAITFTSSSDALVSAATIKKKGNAYRVSCHVYSPVNKTITFNAKQGGTVVSFVTLTNTTANKWTYLEGTLSTSGVTGPFTLEIKTDATSESTVAVDDIIAVPVKARVTLQTASPFKGITSTTDDRGFSSKTTYDHMGRPVNTLDRRRNLVQRNEYAVKNSPLPKPPAGFTSDPEIYYVNSPVVFTPSTWICDSNLSYAWEVDGVAQSTGEGGTLTYTFTTPGQHYIRLTTISSTNGTNSISHGICVIYKFTGNISFSVTNSLGQPSGLSLNCNSGERNVTLNPPQAPPGCTYQIKWFKDNEFIGEGDGFSVYGMAVGEGAPPIVESYVAQITLDCSAYKDCNVRDALAYSGTIAIGVSYSYHPSCQ